MLFHLQLLEGTLNRSKNTFANALIHLVLQQKRKKFWTKREFTEKGRVYYQVLQKPDNSLNFYLNFYKYELLTPFAETGLHNIAKITTSQVRLIN